MLLSILLTTRADAQERLEFRFTRPDGVSETLSGRRHQDVVPKPPDEALRHCGNLDVALTRISYSPGTLATFNYYLALNRPGQTAWEEWQVARPDSGRFAPTRLNTVSVYSRAGDSPPDCTDFHLPIYV
jgi:hypothetical protein